MSVMDATAVVLLLLALLLQLTASSPDCHNAGCLGTLECPPGTLLTPNATLSGCCPACIQYTNFGEACSESTPPCQPGTVCKDDVCKPSDVTQKCQSYAFRDLLWTPKCDADSSYSAIQCKGERLTGRCFCYSKEGKRIFGQEWWSRAENMTCACSRQVEELLASGRKDVTIHCSEDGNFDTLQCDSGLCWCAEPRWGDALGEVVPAAMMEFLPCYNRTLMGDSYLRRCDSESSALNKIRLEMNRHGTLGDAFVTKQCGLDGSFGNIQFENGIRFCTWRDNSKIGSFMTSNLPLSSMNCYCARDTKYFAQEGYGFMMQCTEAGAYQTVQLLDDNPTCVDSDGYGYGVPYEVQGIIICDPYP